MSFPFSSSFHKTEPFNSRSKKFYKVCLYLERLQTVPRKRFGSADCVKRDTYIIYVVYIYSVSISLSEPFSRDGQTDEGNMLQSVQLKTFNLLFYEKHCFNYVLYYIQL